MVARSDVSGVRVTAHVLPTWVLPRRVAERGYTSERHAASSSLTSRSRFRNIARTSSRASTIFCAVPEDAIKDVQLRQAADASPGLWGKLQATRPEKRPSRRGFPFPSSPRSGPQPSSRSTVGVSLLAGACWAASRCQSCDLLEKFAHSGPGLDRHTSGPIWVLDRAETARSCAWGANPGATPAHRRRVVERRGERTGKLGSFRDLGLRHP
jgi:hypothetical protein